MIGNKVKVVVVEDSAFMRLLLTDILSASPKVELIGSAENGKDGVELVKEKEPDVVLMDMNMGEFDGLYAVKRIMAEKPTPILILSAVGNTDLQPIFEALNAGAVDYMNKPSRSSARIRSVEVNLISKILNASQANTSGFGIKKQIESEPIKLNDPNKKFEVLCIGASTGGPAAVEQILKNLPGSISVPVVVAQHMPNHFISQFAQRLNQISKFSVGVASHGQSPVSGNAYILPGDSNTIFGLDSEGGVQFQKHDKVFKDYNEPSINALFDSAATIFKNKALGVLLTGMGKDGAKGLKEIKNSGGFTIAQDESSSVIFGMPKVAAEIGAVSKTLHIKEISRFLSKRL